MNCALSSSASANNILNSLNKMNLNNNAITSNSAITATNTANSNATASTATTQQQQPQRFALASINSNVQNVPSTLLQRCQQNNIQLSPKSTAKAAAAAVGGLQQNLTNYPSSTSSSSSGAHLNQTLQSQLNFLAQHQAQQQQQQQQQQKANNSTLLAAATLLAATSAGSNNVANANATLNSLYQAAAAASSTSSNNQCNLNNTLFVGNLHASLQEIDLIQVFQPFGHIVECCKKWLHFGFVKFMTEEEACHAYVTLNGFRLKGRPMRLEFQNRSKKARLKAILAQATLNASASLLLNGNGSNSANGGSNGCNSNNDQLLSMSNYGNLNLRTTSSGLNLNAPAFNFPSRESSVGNLIGGDDRQQSQHVKVHNVYHHNSHHHQHLPTQHHQAKKMISSQDQTASTLAALSSILNTDQLLKFAAGLSDIDKDLLLLQQESSSSQSNNLPEFNFDLVDSQFQEFMPHGNENMDNNVMMKSSDKYSFLDANYHHPISVSSSSSACSQSSNGTNSSNDELVLGLLKNAISPVEHLSSSSCNTNSLSTSSSSSSPSNKHHDLSSSAFSTTTDSSGLCRSNSFLNEEDSAICSLATSTSVQSSWSSCKWKEDGEKKNNNVAEDAISEHMEFTCSKKSSSPVQNKHGSFLDDEEDVKSDDDDEDCDTSEDASDIPDENLSTSDESEFNDLDFDELVAENKPCDEEDDDQEVDELLKFVTNPMGSEASFIVPQFNFQVIDEDGTVLRKQLDSGIYKSVNQTMSLFIEPHDVLKRVDEFDEYSLFPHGSSSPINFIVEPIFAL